MSYIQHICKTQNTSDETHVSWNIANQWINEFGGSTVSWLSTLGSQQERNVDAVYRRSNTGNTMCCPPAPAHFYTFSQEQWKTLVFSLLSRCIPPALHISWLAPASLDPTQSNGKWTCTLAAFLVSQTTLLYTVCHIHPFTYSCNTKHGK